MTANRKFKQKIRNRMLETGESYTTAKMILEQNKSYTVSFKVGSIPYPDHVSCIIKDQLNDKEEISLQQDIIKPSVENKSSVCDRCGSASFEQIDRILRCCKDCTSYYYPSSIE